MTTTGEHIENGLKTAASCLAAPLAGIAKGLDKVAHEIERGFDHLQLGILPDITPDPVRNAEYDAEYRVGSNCGIFVYSGDRVAWFVDAANDRIHAEAEADPVDTDQIITSADADRLPEWSVIETADEAREQITLWVVHEGFTEIGGDQWVQTLTDRGTIRLIHPGGGA